MNHNVPANKPMRRKGVTIAAAALSVALVAPFAQSVAYPEIAAAAQAQQNNGPVRVGKQLVQQPPVFYANSFGHSNESPVVKDRKATSARAVRTTGVLSLPDNGQYEDIPTFFPKGTKFEPARLDFEFTQRGWFGVARENETDTEKLVGDKRTHMVSQGGGKAHPYVVPETGQILFGLLGGAEGTTEKVPLRARWTDPETGNQYVWLFEQEIQVGFGRVPGGRESMDEPVVCKPGQSVVSPSTEMKLRHTGAFKLGSVENLGGTNFGWYQQPAETGKPAPRSGYSSACMNDSDIPSQNPNVVHPEFQTSQQVEPKYGEPDAGATTSGEPTFYAQDNDAEVKDKPKNVRFEKGEGAPTDISFSVDPNTGVVTLEEDLDNPTDFPIKVTYEDGSSDTARVIFKPEVSSQSQTADQLTPSYKSLTIEQGDKGIVEAPTFDKVATPETKEFEAAPAETSFAPGELNHLPDGLTATVDESTGTVTISATDETKAGSYKVPVTINYKDGSQDVVDVSVDVEAKSGDNTEPSTPSPAAGDLGYTQNIHVAPDNYKRSDSTGMPKLPETITRAEGDVFRFGELPQGFVTNANPSWAGVEEIVREGENPSERILLRINKENGKVEIEAGDNANYSLEKLPIEYVNADKEVKGKDSVSVTVLPIAHSWNGTPTESDEGAVTVPYTGSKADEASGLTPAVTKGSGEATLDDNGNLNYKPGADDKPGDQIEVTISNSNGEPIRVVTFEIPSTQAAAHEPVGKTIIVAQGGDADAAEGIANKGDLPAGTEFEFDGPVDTSAVGEKSAKVVVAYPDGSTETVDVTVNVAAADQDLLPDNERYEPQWNDTTIDDSSQTTVENKGDELPHGTEVELGWSHGGLNQGKEDWDVDLEENGDITVTPGSDAQPGDAIAIEVELNYPDGTSETKTIVVQVRGDREEFVPGNFGELPVLTGDDKDDLTAGDVFTDAPTVNDVHPGDNIITGTGKPGATITVTGPNGFSTTTTVHENGHWSVDLTGGATPETQFIVSQKDGDKTESDQVLVTVGKENVIVPTPGAPGSSELPGSSLGSSNFDIPKHLQCAVFAGGVTAIPLILLSPMHNMYEMMINPHLNGLREQFHRELHALDQQVRRGLGVEGHPALQFMDHINARVNEFNQQLGQVAHDNRHIGLAAAAIAVAGLSFQHCMNTQAASSESTSSVDLSSSSQEQAPARNEAKEDNAGGIVGWFQGLFNRK